MLMFPFSLSANEKMSSGKDLKKPTIKWIKNLNIRAKTIKVLEETIGINLHDLGLGNNFLAMTPKAQAIKEKFGK